MIRPGWFAGAAALVVAVGTFAITGSAQAVGVAAPVIPAAPVPPTPAPLVNDISCGSPSTNSLGFTPHLTLVNQLTTVQRTTAYRPCSSFAFPAITSGYESQTFSFGDDCTMVLLPGSPTFTITWNTTQTTTIAASRTATLSGNTLTVNFAGTVTGGLFAGSNVRQTFKASTPELVSCLAGTGRLPFILSDVTLQIWH